MIDIDELTNELIGDESVRLVVYDDATGLPLHPGMLLKGHPTIGIGRCLDRKGLSRSEAIYLVKNDASEVADELNKNLTWFDTLDSVRQTTLANMAFNMGLNGLLGFHDTLTHIANGDYEAAANGMLTSIWAAQVGSRAKRLAEQMRTGKFVTR